MNRYAMVCVILCVSCVMGKRVGGRYGMVGAPVREQSTKEDAISNIMQSEEVEGVQDLHKASLKERLEKGTLIDSWSQPVAGTNWKYLFTTDKGFECFRVYINFTGSPKQISRYAVGSDKDKVFEECSSFFVQSDDTPPIVKQIFGDDL